MKFKVGDKVKLKKSVRVADDHTIFKGSQGEIVEIRPKQTYCYVVVFKGEAGKFPMLEIDLTSRML